MKLTSQQVADLAVAMSAAAHADVQLRDEELVLAEAKCIQASRRLAECKMLEHSAREAYRPHAKWMSARGECREQDLETE